MRVFVTGASGWLGSAVVPELIAGGHEVIGLARSDGAAATISGAGGEARRGSLDDLDALRDAAAGSDGVIHLAFKHDIAFTGDFEGAAAADRRAIEAFGEAVAGSDRPLVIASGLLGATPGRVTTETDGHGADTDTAVSPRHANAELTLSLASHGVRASIVRLPPTCHGDGDNGFLSILVGIARSTGVAGYVGDGSSRWPATHRLDVATAFRLAVEHAPAGSTIHAVAEEGVAIRDIAAVMGRHLDVPVRSIAPDDAGTHFGFLGAFLAMDSPASSALTRDLLGWQPTRPGLLDDLDEGHYFETTPA